jgi:hypothetical protein
MTTNNFQDGFPNDPISAINFSYFLTDAEKQDWRNWLNTANDDQKNELVETLHSIWLDQKSNEQPATLQPEPQVVQPTQTPIQPAPTPTPVLPEVSEQIVNPFIETTKPAQVVADTVIPPLPIIEEKEVEVQSIPTTSVVSKDESAKVEAPLPSEESFLNLVNSKFDSNPLLDNLEQSAETFPEFEYKTTFEDEKNNPPSNSKPTLSPAQEVKTAQSKTQAPEQSFANQATPTPVKRAENPLMSAHEVVDLYQHFLDSQSKTSTFEAEYKDNQAKLFDKIMETVGEASVLGDKVLSLNDKIVSQAKDIQELKNSTQAKTGTSLQSQINSIREELRKVERNLEYTIDSLQKDFADFRTDITRQYDDISKEVAAFLGDSYKAEGINEKFNRLTSRLEMLEKQQQNSSKFSALSQVRKKIEANNKSGL